MFESRDDRLGLRAVLVNELHKEKGKALLSVSEVEAWRRS